MKKYILIIQIILALLICCNPSHGLLVDLSDNQTRSAVQFGLEHGAATDKLLRKMYCIGGCNIFDEQVIVRSKWHKLARLASLKSVSASELTHSDIKTVLEDDMLQIDITVFGFTMDFARHYRVLLLQDERRISSVKQHADHFFDDSPLQIDKGFPRFRATVRAYFPYASLNVMKDAVLIIEKNGSEYRITLPFHKYR